jgi:hypothetical protein
MSNLVERLRDRGVAGNDHGDAKHLMLDAADEIERLQQRLDAIHLAYIEAANPGIDMEQVKRTRTCGPECAEHHRYVAPCVLDGDAQILAAARASNREWARAEEQRLLDALRNPDA